MLKSLGFSKSTEDMSDVKKRWKAVKDSWAKLKSDWPNLRQKWRETGALQDSAATHQKTTGQSALLADESPDTSKTYIHKKVHDSELATIPPARSDKLIARLQKNKKK